MTSKKKKVKKGFTLVEVIASILILGIIALVVVPIVRKNLDEVRIKAYKETVNEIIRTGKIYASKNSLPGKLEDPIVFICNGESCTNENGDKLNFKGEIPVSGYITIDGLNDVRADYVFNGQFCANGIRGKLDVAKSCNEIDTTIPKVVSITQNKRVFTIKLRDNESGIGAYCITTTNDSDSCTWQDTTETTVEKTLTTSGKYYVFAKDKKDNISKSKSFTTGDIEDPTSPTSGSIGIVSGSNTTGTIQNPVTGSTDESGITYKYLVTNTNTKPNKNDQNFTTSLDFERTCGTLYYGWAVAEDSNGYRSEVYSLGSTQDGTDSYSEWNTCTKACGTGTQERTNSCQLVTTELSQTCNEQECCSSTNYTPSNGTWGACSKTCGTGSQTYYETRTYTSAYDGSACGVTNNVDTGVTQQCNTQACCYYETGYNHSVGDSLSYGGLNWYVLSDNGSVLTLVLKGNYTTGAFGTTSSFASASIKTVLNTNFVNAYAGIKNSINAGQLVVQSSTNTYVRLLTQSEVASYGSRIANTSGTPYWTMTASGANVWYAQANGGLSYTNGTCSGGTYYYYTDSSYGVDGDWCYKVSRNPVTGYAASNGAASTVAAPSSTTLTTAKTASASGCGSYVTTCQSYDVDPKCGSETNINYNCSSSSICTSCSAPVSTAAAGIRPVITVKHCHLN